MKTICQFSLILLLGIGSYSMAVGQTQNAVMSIVSIENQHLIAQINNSFRVVAQQEEPVLIHQLTATLSQYGSEKVPLEILERNGYFSIRPDTIGLVELRIAIKDTFEIKRLMVKPIGAVGRLGRHQANTDVKIDAAEFKVPMGIIANIECCGFDAKCRVLGFETIRVAVNSQSERLLNQGARFESATESLIQKAEAGDIYIFRKIKYRCPGSDEPQRLDDMVFEIK